MTRDDLSLFASFIGLVAAVMSFLAFCSAHSVQAPQPRPAVAHTDDTFLPPRSPALDTSTGVPGTF